MDGSAMLATDPSQHAPGGIDPLEAAEGCPQEDEPAMFKSDSFRMNCMKVLQCSKRYVHDWTECPFAHPQEKARRRDPRVHTYTGIACPSMKKEGACAFGDHCPYAHNVFEYWLHPTRYRTQLCNDGSNCKRKICFFAHSLDELRVPACKPFVSPEALAAAAAAAAADAEAKRKAGTVGSPMLGSLQPPAGQQLADPLAQQQFEAAVEVLRSSGGVSPGAVAEASPIATAAMGASSADVLSATLAQLQGRGFSQQEQQVIELVTNMLSQDKISPAQAASILQAMLPASALHLLQSHLLAPASPVSGSGDLGARSNSEPLRDVQSRMSFEEGAMASARRSMPCSPVATMYASMAALQAGQQAAPQYTQQAAPYPGASPRASMDASSMRSSFDNAGLRDSMDYTSMRGSIDYSRQASFDYSRQGSMDIPYAQQPAGVQMAQASAFYQPFQGLAPVQESLAYMQPSPSAAAAYAQQQQQYAAAAAVQAWRYALPAQYEEQQQQRASMDANTELRRMSNEFRRLSMEASEARASIDRRAPPAVANPFASSFFAPATAAGGPASPGGRLYAPGPNRTLSVPEQQQQATPSSASPVPRSASDPMPPADDPRAAPQ